MITITGFKASALAFAAAAASLSALAVPVAGHAATATTTASVGTATLGICIPCLEPCGPICFVDGAVADASRASGAAEDGVRLD